MKKKTELPHFRRKNGDERTVRFSIAFKTSVIYTVLFGVVLAAVVGVMTWSLAARAARYQRLDRVCSFLADHAVRGGVRQFDYSSFAQANNIYIEISRSPDGPPVFYGTQPKPGVRYDEVRRRLDGPPDKGAFLRVVALEETGITGSITMPWFLTGLAALLVLAAVGGALLMRRMMRPVYEMTRTARAISASDLSRRIAPVRSHDELNELAETFNGMLDRIQTSYEQQKRFVSDASHELRTPLSVISGYANLMRRWGGDDKAVRDEAVGKILEEAGNMKRLVEDLLFLARADQQTQEVHAERFSASGMMTQIAAETRVIDAVHTVREEIEPGVMLTADPALIKQAVRAVVENSRKFTPEGGGITLRCRNASGRVVFSVEDTGAGIGPEELPHVFDRFYKADAARTRGSGSSTGLGLSIVKWIVEQHGGEITAESEPGRGTRMIFSLPENGPAKL